MRADRFSLLLLAGLALAAGRPAAGQTFTFRIGKPTVRESSFKVLAGMLALQVAEVQKTFDMNRRTLRPVRLPSGEAAYRREEVVTLIDHTEKDLDRAIANLQPSSLEPLRAWSAEEIRRIQEKLAPAPGRTAASFPGVSAPRAVAVVASLGGLSLPWLASVTATAPQQDTVPAETSDRLLDQVGNVISRIFFLASHDDLEVKLWVGSTVRRAQFSFWPQGHLKGDAKASLIVRTDGTRTVLRGLYDYRALHAEGSITELVQYPGSAGAPAAQLASERLDLVNGSSFFCCRFNEQYCHHVADEKDCRP